MKKTALLFITILLTWSMAGQEITGQWNGILKFQGVQLRIVFHISKSNSGYSSTMDSPDQGATGIPVTSVIFADSVLKLEVAAAGITYEGTLNKVNVITGTFKQMGMSFPLDLSRKQIEKEKQVRPQEPAEPYPYYSEDVRFENTTDSVFLAGTLTLPEKGGHFPAVILITGSGPQNRDEELMGHKPFLVLADYLTRHGIAVLRYDDRGTNESTGNFKTATTADFATDAEAAAKYLKSRKEINKKKIGLIGHSEGGLIALMVATKSKDISFIVLMAGPGIPGHQILLLQQELIGKASGMSENDLQKVKAINKGAFNLIVNARNTDSLKKELTNYIKQTLKDYPDSEIPPNMNEDDFVNIQVRRLTSPWMLFFIKFNPVPALEKVMCPVLAINGEKDLQVPAKENLEAIKTALEKGGNKYITIKELPGLNHLFQECKTGLPSEYAKIEQTISPVALNEITNWILEQVK